ncbi:MAG: hypothetical protein PWQ50_183 [Methanolobus sp.]|jgi:hypothetical protein|nr:hypothetical protein [Methanolobus sp.]
MKDFFFAADKSRVDKALAANHTNILFSAAASCNPTTEKLYVPKNHTYSSGLWNTILITEFEQFSLWIFF